MSVCKACAERGQTWNGSPPKCAFESGEFSPDNWNCATLNQLRDLVYEGQYELPAGVSYQYCDDQKYATVRVDHVEGGENDEGTALGLALWMSWYKNRGATDALWLLDSSGPARRPTEKDVLAVLSHYGR